MSRGRSAPELAALDTSIHRSSAVSAKPHRAEIVLSSLRIPLDSRYPRRRNRLGLLGAFPVKRFLAATAVIALCSAPALAAPPPVFNWTGFYVGGHIGAIVEHGQLSNLPPGGFFLGPPVPTPSNDFQDDGFLGGGQLGYNWQWTNWVAGVEGDISASHLSNSGPFNIVTTGIVSSTTAGTAEFRSDPFITVRGRFGYAAGNLLFYGTGGFAWARE